MKLNTMCYKLILVNFLLKARLVINFIQFCLFVLTFGQVVTGQDKYWKIDIKDIEIKRRTGTGSFAEVYFFGSLFFVFID